MPYLTPSSTPADTVCRRLYIPNSPEWLAVVNGAISELMKPYRWEQFGAVSPEEAAERMQQMYLEYVRTDCLIGLITPYITATVPPNCLPCDGSLHLRADYPYLYEVIEPLLRADADSFYTPDVRGRLIVPTADNFPLYEIGGQRHHTILIENLPEHSHPTQPHGHTTLPHEHAEGVAVPTVVNGGLEAPAASAAPAPGVTAPASVTVLESTVIVDAVGGGQPIEVMPPYVSLRYCVVAR